MLLGGNASQLSLGFRVYLKDEFSSKVKTLKDGLKDYKDEFSAFQENVRAARNTALGIAAAGTAALRGLGSAVREGAQFGYVMQNVGVVSAATNKQLYRLSELAKRLGSETMLMPEDIASGMRFMAMAGQDALQIMQSMPAAVNLAGVSMTALGGKMGAADILTNHLKAYGWAADKSTQMSDILAEAVTNANVTLTDLGNSVRYVAATSRNLKVPMEETTAMLMALGNAGIQGSMAGTALENMYRYMTMALSELATGRQTYALEQLGITLEDLQDKATGGYKPMVEVLKVIREGLLGMDPIHAQNVVKELFGVRGQRGGMTLVRQLADVEQFTKLLTSASIQGSAAQKMHDMMNTLEGDFLKLISTWKALKATLAESLGPYLRPILEGLKMMVNLFKALVSTKVGGFLIGITTSVIAVTTVVNALRAAMLGLAYMNRTLTVSATSMISATRAAMGMNFFGGAGLRTFADKRAAVLNRQMKAGSGLQYSQKRGMFYTVVPGGAAKWVPKASPTGKVAGNFAAQFAKSTGTRVLARTLPALAGIGRGLLGILGGVPGIIATLAFTGIPLLISALRGNKESTERNTQALIGDKEKVSDKEMFSLLYSSGASIKSLTDAVYRLLESGIMSSKQLEKLIENGEILNYLINQGLINQPMVVDSVPSPQKDSISLPFASVQRYY